jgi:hypothetical protein
MKPAMSVLGIDIAKRVFYAVGMDERGKIVLRKESMEMLEIMPDPAVPLPAAVPASPLVPMTGRNGASSAPKTLVNSKRVIAEEKRPHSPGLSGSPMSFS